MPVERTELSRVQARRIGLHAQGFTDPRPPGRVDRRHLRRVLDRIGLIQIDSVNVLVRSQELPLFARLGSHPRDLLTRMTVAAELFEFWCHEASLLPIDLWPLMRWRMERSIELMWRSTAALARDEPGYIESVYEEVRNRGPLAAGDLSDPGVKTAGMWGRNRGKKALEHLFYAGRISARRRAGDFARVYDLTERMIPAQVLLRTAPPEADAQRELLLLAACSLGVGTARDLADYHRLSVPVARPLVDELAEDGRLVRVVVEGWKHPAFLHPSAHLPRRVRARALLSPFDSLIWERDRAERLFGFHYRIGIYTPKEKRVHGYYVLPFLLGDRLVARVDLKADRAASTLAVQAAFAEVGVDHGSVAEELAAELATMAGWLGLNRTEVRGGGDLAPALRQAVARSSL